MWTTYDIVSIRNGNFLRSIFNHTLINKFLCPSTVYKYVLMPILHCLLDQTSVYLHNVSRECNQTRKIILSLVHSYFNDYIIIYILNLYIILVNYLIRFKFSYYLVLVFLIALMPHPYLSPHLKHKWLFFLYS